MTAEQITHWLMTQDSYTYKPQEGTVKVMEDPKVMETYAVRFTDQDGETVDLLFVCGVESLGKKVDDVLEECLEEVEYETWPPESGSLRFF